MTRRHDLRQLLILAGGLLCGCLTAFGVHGLPIG